MNTYKHITKMANEATATAATSATSMSTTMSASKTTKTTSKTTKTFRYKFSEDILPYMKDFSKIHQHDDRVTFKESWDDWYNENIEIIEREERRLTSIGFTGDIKDKMYKSMRYYYRKKSNKKTEPMVRRIYTRLSKEIITVFDEFIQEHSRESDFKPSKSFKECVENNYYVFEKETERLREAHDMEQPDIMSKFKKTFNNRYYLYSKKST